MFPLNPHKIREKYGLKSPINQIQNQPQQPILSNIPQIPQVSQTSQIPQNIQLKITSKIPSESITTPTTSTTPTIPITPTTPTTPTILLPPQTPLTLPIQTNPISSDILTEDSPKIQPINNIKITLKEHQRSLVRRCLNIEKSYIQQSDENYGIMSDKPGAGKTYVVLSLLWFIRQYYIQFNVPTNERLTSLIIVPQNIISQWCDAIETFSTEFKFKIFTDYNDITNLQYSPNILYEYDFLISIPLYYHNIATTLNNLKYSINRLFFDEIDSISHLLQIPIQANFIWFISASFNPDATGKYKIIKNDLPFHTAKCEEEYIHKGFILPPPKKINYFLYNYIIDEILRNVLKINKNIIKNIYSFNYRNSWTSTSSSPEDKKIINNFFILDKRGENEMDFLRFMLQDCKMVLQQYPSLLNQLKAQIEEIESTNKLDELLMKRCDDLKMEYQKKRNDLIYSATVIKTIQKMLEDYQLCSMCFKEVKFGFQTVRKTPCCREMVCSQCFETNWSARLNSCQICLSSYVLKNYVEIVKMGEMSVPNLSFDEHYREKVNEFIQNYGFTRYLENGNDVDNRVIAKNYNKMQQLEEWIRNIMKIDKKIILFSNEVHSFPYIKSLFKKYEYPVVEMDGGNFADIDKVIQQYKKGDANVLLLSGDYATFGMNLEFTTDILFMNKIEESKEKQIIGRAQRPGRNTELVIYSFYYLSEIIDFHNL